MVALVADAPFGPLAPAPTPAAAWLPITPWPLATLPAWEALLGTPGNAPPACERSNCHSAMIGL